MKSLIEKQEFMYTFEYIIVKSRKVNIVKWILKEEVYPQIKGDFRPFGFYCALALFPYNLGYGNANHDINNLSQSSYSVEGNHL